MMTVFFFIKANRNSMTKDAKQAAKLEKKLKILLGGYQVSVENWHVELFGFLNFFNGLIFILKISFYDNINKNYVKVFWVQSVTMKAFKVEVA